MLNMILEIEIELFPDPQLAVVVVKAFSGDAYDLGSILEIDSFSIDGSSVKVNISPLFHDFQHFTDGPLATFLLNHTTAGFLDLNSHLPISINVSFIDIF